MPAPMAELPIKILAVDDVPENLVALRALLNRHDLMLLEASSGTEALELLLQHDVALALVDVQMPEMNGFELAELMRGAERTRNVPIIFLTAETPDPGRVFRGYEAGAVDFLFKPLHPDLFRSKIGVFVELHRQKVALAVHAERLEQMLRLSDLFIGVLGHDLRNPLTAIRTGVEVVMRKSDQDPATVSTLERVRRSSDRMQRLIQQLLDFARSRLGGGMPVEPAPADLGKLVQQSVAEWAESETKLVVRTSGDLMGTWDQDRLLQLLSNLLGNAIEHGTPGEPVTVTVESDSEHVQLDIRNAGSMPSALLGNLFDPFRRLRSAGSGRIGLGLYIVDQIVRGHGGSIRVTSSAEEGTSVRVQLPRHSQAGKAGTEG